MLAQGAAVLDLGAQSTRPGAAMVGPEEELRRLLPALSALQPLRGEHPALQISIDTFEARVAEATLAAGADWINDVRGANHSPEAPGGTLRDPAMLPLIAAAGCPVVLMHSRGTSQSMDRLAVYGDVLAEVRSELQAATHAALAAGIKPQQILWDPGLGFAKTTEHNLELLQRLSELTAAPAANSERAYPVVVGPSRKRFIGAVLGEPRPRARLWGTAAVCAVAVSRGARVLRVHDVGPIAQVAAMAAAI